MGRELFGSTKTLDVHVAAVRRKLAEAAGGSGARVPAIVIRRKHGRVPQGQDVLEHGVIRLHRAGTLPSRVEPSPQHVAPIFRALEALGENVALPATLFEFGAEASAAGQMRDEITNEPPEPGH